MAGQQPWKETINNEDVSRKVDAMLRVWATWKSVDFDVTVVNHNLTQHLLYCHYVRYNRSVHFIRSGKSTQSKLVSY